MNYKMLYFIFCCFVCVSIYCHDQPSISTSEFKEFLNSKTLSNKKKAAIIALYLKTKKNINNEDINILRSVVLNPYICNTREMFNVIQSFLVKNQYIDRGFIEKLKNSIAENQKKSNYIVWCLEFIENFTLESLCLDTNKEIDVSIEKQYLEQVNKLNEYIVDIFEKSNYTVLAAAIEQKSIICSAADDLFNSTNNYVAIVKALLKRVESTHNLYVLEYLNDPEGWSANYINERGESVSILMRIADNVKIYQENRIIAESILSRIFLIKKKSNISWKVWYAENIDKFDRIKVSYKILLKLNVSNDIRIAAMLYIYNLQKQPDKQLLTFIDEVVGKTNSIKLCFSCESIVLNYLKEFPESKLLKQLYLKAMNNCRRLYKNYKPSKNDDVYYFISGESATNNKTTSSDFFSNKDIDTQSDE